MKSTGKVLQVCIIQGYPLTQYSIQPFSDFELTQDPVEAQRRKLWNQKCSGLRVFIEDTFGCWKGHFPILRNLPGYNIKSMYHFVESLMIIHNILEEFGDDPMTIAGFNGLEDEDVREELQAFHRQETAEDLYRMGLARRKRLLDLSEDI